MKICCINPPIQDFYSTSIRRQPLGLLYIIASLKRSGHDVVLLNFQSTNKHILPLPEEFSYLSPYISGNENIMPFPFKHYHHFGVNFNEITRQIINNDAQLYMISSLFTTYYQEVEKIISIIRKNKKLAKIAVGGYHAALYPDFFLKQCSADYVINGEGEDSAVILAECIALNKDITNVPNLIYSNKDNLCFTEKRYERNIDKFPIPGRDFLNKKDFKIYKKSGISMITSRGCPNRCDFCTNKIIWGNSYRMRSISSVINEIEASINRYKVEIINFEDDNLFASNARSVALLKEIIDFQHHKNVKLDLTAMNGISLENVDENILHLMNAAGFSELNISLVTFSSKLQKNHGRPFDSTKFSEIATIAKKLGMNIRAYYILGLPDQKKEEIENTLSFLQKLNVKIFPSVYYNINSPQWQWKMQRSSAFYNETHDLNRNDLLYYFHKSYNMK